MQVKLSSYVIQQFSLLWLAGFDPYEQGKPLFKMEILQTEYLFFCLRMESNLRDALKRVQS